MIIYEQETREPRSRIKLLKDIKAELDCFTPAMMKKVVMDFIKNDDYDTLSIYLQELRNM